MRVPALLAAMLLCALSTAGCLDIGGKARTDDNGGGNPFPPLDDPGGGDLPPVDGLPNTRLRASPTDGRAPLRVVFALDATDPEDGAMSWSLDFGDGSRLSIGTSLPTTLTHIYRSQGTFAANFVVSDAGGSTSSSVSVTVLPSLASNTTTSSATTTPPSTTTTTTTATGTFTNTTTSSTSSSTSSTSETTSTSTSSTSTSTTTSSSSTSSSQTSSTTTSSGPPTTTSSSSSSTSSSSTTSSTSSSSSSTSETTTTSSSSTSSGPPPNTAPVPTANASPQSGPAPLNVTFSLDATDAESDALEWTLDFGDGSAPAFGTTLPATADHTYAAGNHTALFSVSDGQESAAASIFIEATAA